MKTQCYLGVDLGAESGRVMAGLWDGKRLRLKELHRFPNGPVAIGDSLRWNVLGLWSEIQSGLAIAGRFFGDSIVSVGVDTWGVDFALLSKTGDLLSPPYHYRDRRTAGVMKKAFGRVPRNEIFAATGLQFMEINSLYQLLALKENQPEILDAAGCLLMMADFFHWCLCGSKVAEFTNATTTQFFHPTKRTWSHGLLKQFGLPSKILPEVVAPGANLGALRPAIAEATGLRSVKVVVPATHDTGSAVVAVPTTHEEPGTWAYISSGTWSLMGIEVREAKLSEKELRFNLTNEGGVDGTYRLLKNIIGLWLVQRCKRAFEAKGKKFSYEQLVQMAKAAPRLKSLIDPDDPRFLNPADMPKTIQEYCRETKQPIPTSERALVRCALENLALKYRAVLDCLEVSGGKRIEVVHIVGGGCRNELLNQFTADACERPVVAGPVEATVLGNILLQARAAGELSSLSEIRAIVRNSGGIRVYEPRHSEAVAWKEARERIATMRR